MIDRNGVRIGVVSALVLLSGALSPVAAQDARSVVRVATAKPAARETRVAPAVADAAMQGDMAKVRALLAQQNDVNVAQGDGMTALHWAADRGDVAMTALLLRSGAKLTGTTKNGGYAPLHVASRAGHGAVVQALLAAGADAKTLTSTGATAMHLAASAGDVASVKALLAHKADPNALELAWGQTPLMFAAAERCWLAAPMRRSAPSWSIFLKSWRVSRRRPRSGTRCSSRISRRRRATRSSMCRSRRPRS